MNTQPTPISDRIVSQFRKGEATSDGLILTMVELELKLAAICRERNDALAESIRWMSIAEGRGRTDDDDTGKAMSNLIRQRDEAREELSEWRILNGWGGTPEIINDFIKGQQTRIHHAQDLEAELAAVTKERDQLKRWTSVNGVIDLQRERDEAREEMIGWRNKWQVAVEMAALAENKLATVTAQRDRLAAVLQRIRDGYGGQVASPNCCEDCDYLLPIDEALQSLTPKS
jgi:hypothetical protein